MTAWSCFASSTIVEILYGLTPQKKQSMKITISTIVEILYGLTPAGWWILHPSLSTIVEILYGLTPSHKARSEEA